MTGLPASTAAALPDGIIAEMFTRYRVGPYHYTSLADALAQHQRQSASEG